MQNKQKIHSLFLTRWYPHRYDPMPGLFVERHAEAIAAFCKVSVLYIHPDDKLFKKNYEIITNTKKGVFTIRIYYKTLKINLPVIGEVLKGIRYYRYVMKGIKLIKRANGDFDLIHVNILTRLGLIALIYRLLYGTPYIVTEHWSRYLPIVDTYHGAFRKFITKHIVKNASAVTTVTENLKQSMLSHDLKNNNYMIIPNVVDTYFFKIDQQNKRSNNKQIVHISCFEDRSKNISGILRVIKRLSDKRNDFEIRLIGEGIDLEKLKKYASELKIKDRHAFFDGLLEDGDLVNSINESDFMVMFSNYENMPVVINESFSCGVPVIATNVGGISEVVNDKNGILIEKGNEDQLLETINYFLDHYQYFDKNKIRKTAIKKFSKEVVGKKFFSLYKKVIPRNTPI